MEIIRKQPEPIEDIVVITMSLEEARALTCFVAEHNRAFTVGNWRTQWPYYFPGKEMPDLRPIAALFFNRLFPMIGR